MTVSNLTLARRRIPWFLVNYLMIPLTTFLILIGYGKSEARDFWEEHA